MRNRKGLSLDGREGREELGGVKKEETNPDTLREKKKSIFNDRKK